MNGSLRRVAGDVVRRLLAADGTTHVRALAYESAFVVMSGFIGVVGLASLLDVEGLRGIAVELGRSISPGPAGRLLEQAAESGASGGIAAAVLGLGAALSSGTLAMAELERSANRLGGSERDRPLVRRYAVAFALAATIGVVLVAGALLIGAGRAVAAGIGWSDETAGIWSAVRWPIGIAVVTVAVMLLFRAVPRRRLGPWRAILGGALVAMALWVGFTALLALYFSIQTSSPYGPLLSVVALLLWSMLASLALHVGLATTCALAGRPPRERDEEAVRIPDAEGPLPPPPSPVEAGGRPRRGG